MNIHWKKNVLFSDILLLLLIYLRTLDFTVRYSFILYGVEGKNLEAKRKSALHRELVMNYTDVLSLLEFLPV